MLTKRDLLRSTALAAITASTAKSIPAFAQTNADRPGFFGAKDIAEAGFIYGLPIVMGYGVMYEVPGGSQLGAVQGAVQPDRERGQCIHLQRHGRCYTEQSDTPYSVVSMDLRAEPLVLSVPAVDPKRYYSVMLCDANTYNYGYIGTRATGSEAGDYIGSPDRTWKGATPPGSQKGVPVEHPVLAGDTSHRALQPRRYRQRQEGSERLQGCRTLFGADRSNPLRRQPRRSSTFRK